MSSEFNQPQFNEVEFNQGPAAPATTNLFSSRIYVDWNADGDFLDTGEDVSGDVLILKGITASIGKDQLRAESPPKIGDFKAILTNEDGDYSLENTSSPLAGLLEPGKKLIWEIAVNDSPKRVYTGYLEDLLQNPEYGDWTVELPALDSLVRLRDKTISTNLLENVRTDQAIAAILDAAGWPTGERILSQGGITLAFYWATEVDAFSAIQEIVNTEGPASRWGVDSAGNFIFEDRRYRLTQTRSTVSQGSFATTTGLSINISEFSYRKLFKDIINKCILTVRSRAAQSESAIWSIEDPIIFNANETKVFKVSASDPFKSAVVPSASSGINEVQKIRLTGNPTGGFFHVSFRGASPPPLGAKTASAQIGITTGANNIRTALEATETIGPGNVSVTGGPLYTGSVYNDLFIEFKNSLGSQDVELLGTQSGLTGGTNPAVVVEQTVQGRRPDYKISAGSVSSITLDRTSGGSALLTITAGPTGLTLDWLQVRAMLVTVEKEFDVKNSIDSSASITRHGEQRPRGPFRAEISEADALRVANAYVSWYQKARATAEIVLDSTDGSVLTHQIERLVSDRISIIDSHTGVNGDFWIENRRHELIGYDQLITRFGLEAVPVHGDAHTDTHSDASHSDAAHSDSAHSDTHSDVAHSDVAHSDAGHSDSHTDYHSDGGHSDSHSDAHTDDHTDAAHSDIAHSDVAHGDTAHSDTHSDVAHGDSHSDDHTDIGLPDPFSDFHSDSHTDDHTDSHSDVAHSDTAHSDTAHSDIAHSDIHSDVAHADSHTDAAHTDDHTDTHSDAAHSDGAHTDSHTDTHSDVAHADSGHSDTAHSDTHSDTHSDDHADIV